MKGTRKKKMAAKSTAYQVWIKVNDSHGSETKKVKKNGIPTIWPRKFHFTAEYLQIKSTQQNSNRTTSLKIKNKKIYYFRVYLKPQLMRFTNWLNS